MAEGEDLVDAALAHGVRPVALLVDAERVPDDDPRTRRHRGAGRALPRAAEQLLARASALAAPPRVIGVFPQPPVRSFRDVRFPPSLGVYLAGVADPGNVGTLVRTSAALGADWLALGPGSADAFHPRAVRAAMGATFARPAAGGRLAGRPGDPRRLRRGRRGPAGRRRAVGGRPHAADACSRSAPSAPASAERSTSSAPDRAVVRVTIPQAAGSESLNVAAAGAALLAEAGRQRALAGGAGAGASDSLGGR